jgi:hypothetical protein
MAPTLQFLVIFLSLTLASTWYLMPKINSIIKGVLASILIPYFCFMVTEIIFIIYLSFGFIKASQNNTFVIFSIIKGIVNLFKESPALFYKSHTWAISVIIFIIWFLKINRKHVKKMP